MLAGPDRNLAIKPVGSGLVTPVSATNRPVTRPPARVLSVIPDRLSPVTTSAIEPVSGGENKGGGGGPPARMASSEAAMTPASKSRSGSYAVIVYGPGGSFWIENDPSAAASACSSIELCAPGAWLNVSDVRLTIAPGAGAPDEFTTMPEMLPARAVSTI